MKIRFQLTVYRSLYYGFLFLTVLSGLAFLSMLTNRIGVFDRPGVRGWVRIMDPGGFNIVTGAEGAQLTSFNRDQAFFFQRFPDTGAYLGGGYLGYTLLEILSWLVAIAVIYQLSRLFRNLDSGKVFRIENVRRMRVIAAAIAVWPVINYVAESLLFRQVIRGGYFPDLRIAPNHQVEMGVLMIVVALIILALVEVFNAGVRLSRNRI